jgi:hypothetical protein
LIGLVGGLSFALLILIGLVGGLSFALLILIGLVQDDRFKVNLTRIELKYES